MRSPILRLPVPDRPFTLSTDFSSEALGAVLEQEAEDSRMHVVAYASRCCAPAESRLISSEGEYLALLFGIKKFHHYLAGGKFTVATDNAALQYLEQCKGNNAKLTRWALHLTDYDFVVRFCTGKAHANADGLSRVA